MSILAIIQARMASSRLPKKIMMKVAGQSLLEINLDRIKKSKLIDKVILATTNLPSDDETENLGISKGITVYRGAEDDVLDRFYQAGISESPTYVVRLTADCPLIDATVIDSVISFAIRNQLDYCSNTLEPTYPDGQDVEVFKVNCLQEAWKEATLQSEREHVTPYIWKNSTAKGGVRYQAMNFSNPEGDFSAIRMTVDELADFRVVENLIHALGKNKTWLEYAKYLQNNSDVNIINTNIKRNEGYDKSIRQDGEV